jgi:hypothetical protein
MSMNTREILVILFWAGAMPLAVILLTIFILARKMRTGFLFGILLLPVFVIAGYFVIEPFMPFGYILRVGAVK